MNPKLFFSTLLLLFALSLFTTCSKDDKDDNDGKETPLADREQSIKDYQDNYLGSALSNPNWTGSTTDCIAGSVSSDSHLKVIKRINYFRKLVGLPADITHNSSQNSKCQEAALYMAKNKTLTHTPINGTPCYSAGCYEAANHGNIAISWGGSPDDASHSVNAVSGYMEDPGTGNLAVGHRAWLLHPELKAIGHGSVFIPNQNNLATNCLMWGGNTGSTPSNMPDFVAYPPANFIPAPLVFPRWSFSVPNASFNSATITMKDESGGNISLNIIHRAPSNVIPGSRIVWEPSGINTTSDSDVKYTVTISNISSAPNTSYTYEVTILSVANITKKIQPPSVDFYREIK